jgi:hypothetical protein
MVAAFLAACGDGDSNPTGVEDTCTDDTGAVTVTVSSGSSGPVFDWSPPCAVALVLVEQDAGDTWLVATDDATWGDPTQANLITPPVTYGIVPSTAADEYGPDPLQPGVTHDFILWRVPPGSTADCVATGFGMCMLANRQFVP